MAGGVKRGWLPTGDAVRPARNPEPLRGFDFSLSEIPLHGGHRSGDVMSWLRHRGYNALECWGGVIFGPHDGPTQFGYWGETLVDRDGEISVRRGSA